MARAGMVEIMGAMGDQIRAAVDALLPAEFPVQVEPRLVLNPTPPTVDMYPGSLARDRESAGFDDISGGYLFTVRARVSTADNDAGQDLLLRLMDDTDDLCLAAMVVDDPTLNGYASSVDVRDPTGYVLYESTGGDGALLGFSFTAMVLPAES